MAADAARQMLFHFDMPGYRFFEHEICLLGVWIVAESFFFVHLKDQPNSFCWIL